MTESNTGTKIRPAGPSDREAVFELAARFATSFVVDQQAFAVAFDALLEQESAYLLVAEKEGSVIAYCLAFDHLTLFANGRVTWVEEVMVRADRRRSGIGARLMQAVEDWARLRRSRLVGLATRRAAPFYRALGYEESATYFRKLLQAHPEHA